MNSAIEEIYEVFSKYPENRNMEGSPLYGNKVTEWNYKLLSKSLRELNEDDLSRFCGSALLTWGNLSDFKHFLPRVLELTFQLKHPYELYITFTRMVENDWMNWDSDEVNSITNYLLLLWKKTITLPESNNWILRDYVLPILYIYQDKNELLNIWQTDQSISSTVNLVEYVTDNYKSIIKKSTLPGLNKHSDIGLKFKEWLTTDAVLAKIVNHSSMLENHEIYWKIDWLLAIIEEIGTEAHNRVDGREQ